MMGAVIAKGLKEGETVVIDGQLRVIPGRPVEVKAPAGTAAAGGKEGGKGKKKENKEEVKEPKDIRS